MLRHIMERHVAEIDALWSRRRQTVVSDAHTATDWRNIDQRITNHAAALVAGHATTRALLQSHAIDDDRDAAFAASYPLLLGDDQLAREELTQQLKTIAPEALPGLRDAWMQVALRGETDRVRAVMHGDSEYRSVSAALILAAHRALIDGDLPLIARLFDSADSLVRALAWRIPRYLATSDWITPAQYQSALNDTCEQVRENAMLSAAWCDQDRLKNMCADALPDVRSARAIWLIINSLDGREWGELIEPTVGPERCALIGDGGFQHQLKELVDAMDSSRATLAIAAAQAYERITGFYPASDKVALLHDNPDSLDDFEREFVESATLPDPSRAVEHWSGLEDRDGTSQRWNRGVALTRDLDPAEYLRLDLRALWGHALQRPVVARSSLASTMRISQALDRWSL